ncbi:MAG: PqqD family protein [Proteobacteria bacterium]|nr:PqqD family protein [Pseudomonadota bacterium]
MTLRFYGDEFIFDTASGMFFRISPTASFILRSLQAGTRADRLADEIQERYGISRSAALRDVQLLRNDLAGIEALDRFAL